MVAALADYENSMADSQTGPVQIGAVMADVLARYGLAVPNRADLPAAAMSQRTEPRPTWAPVFAASTFEQAADPWLDEIDCPLADALLATW